MKPLSETGSALEFLTIGGTLKDLLQRRATGVLTVSADGMTKQIFFRNGLIVFASSNLERDRLGDILLEHGVISRRHYEESVRQVRSTDKKQGTILVQMGAITPKDLFRGLTLQVREIILSLFSWEKGTYSFVDSLPEQEELVMLRIHPALIILEGIVGRAARVERFRTLWDAGSLRITPQPDPPWPLEDLRLPAEAHKILSHLEEGTPWAKIPRLIGLSEDDAASFLYALHVLDLVKALPLAAGGSAPAAPAPEETAAGEEEDQDTLPSLQQIEELSDKISKLNLYQVLRLNPNAGGDVIKSAYLTLAKMYHPDRFFDSSYEDARGRITAIFMRINEAYTVLSNPRNRTEYDRKEIRLESATQERQDPDRDSRIAREQYAKGMELIKAGDPWAAAESFRWAVHLNPRNPLYHTWLGSSLARTRKRLHEAEEHCKTAITLDYSNPLFYVHLGQVYKAGKLNQKAKKQFETALKLNPGFVEATRELKNLGK